MKQLPSQASQKIIVIYRSSDTPKELLELAANNAQVLLPIFANSTPKKDVSNASKKISQETNKLDLIINGVGYLHNAEYWPEKVYVRSLPTSYLNQLM